MVQCFIHGRSLIALRDTISEGHNEVFWLNRKDMVEIIERVTGLCEILEVEWVERIPCARFTKHGLCPCLTICQELVMVVIVMGASV